MTNLGIGVYGLTPTKSHGLRAGVPQRKIEVQFLQESRIARQIKIHVYLCDYINITLNSGIEQARVYQANFETREGMKHFRKESSIHLERARRE